MEEIIIEVVDVIDVEDGAEIILNLNEAGQDLLIKEGIISILKSSLSEDKNEKGNCDRTTGTDVGCQC